MLAIKTSAVMSISEAKDYASFLALQDEWNMLVKTARNEPFYRHEYIRTWLDNFAPKAKLRILTGRDCYGRLIALLPLTEARTAASFHHLPLKQVISTANEYSPRFDLIAEDGESAARLFFSHLASDKSWDVLKLINVPECGNAWRIYHAAEEAGFPVGAWESQRSPYLKLPAEQSELMNRLRAKFKANLRRRRKKLAEKGEIELERFTGGPELESLLQECFAVEASGWKGRGGFAAHCDHRLQGFYADLAQFAADDGMLSILILRLNGRPIAFHYGFDYEGVFYLLMTSYDESFKECSPGQLLTEDALQDCISNGLKEFDFLGGDLDWKMEWSENMRPHNWLYVFRNNSFGLALQKAKFRLIPAAKAMLKKWRSRNNFFALRSH